jgi:ABC-type sugar transport system permease subunit
LGFVLFFARPFWETLVYAFSAVEVSLGEGISTSYIGWENFTEALTIDAHFRTYMIRLYEPFFMVIVVVIFSLLAAMLINGKYFGRGLVRAVFFIPIIMGANIATAVLVGDDTISNVMSMGEGFSGFSGFIFMQVLMQIGLPPMLISFLMDALNRIFEVLAQSGVPILIFLAGLQSISPSLYEVAIIEGSTKYETFWKVTFPMITPMVLLSTVYTITDLFSRHSLSSGVWISRVTTMGGQTGLLEYIRFVGFTNINYGLASAMSSFFILVTLVVVVVITFLISKVVFYYD